MSQSETSIQALQAKLQAALKEQVTLLECVQQLEIDKTSLEEHLNAMLEGMSQTVRYDHVKSGMKKSNA